MAAFIHILLNKVGLLARLPPHMCEYLVRHLEASNLTLFQVTDSIVTLFLEENHKLRVISRTGNLHYTGNVRQCSPMWASTTDGP